MLVFPPEDENDKYIILPYFWIPEDNLDLRVRRDHVPYDVWERQGYLQTTEGNVVHYGYIEKFIESLTECSGLDAEIESLLEEIDVVTELTKRCIAENSQTAQNQEEYAARYNGFVERYEKAKSRVEDLRSIKTGRQVQADAIGAFMFEMQELDTLSEFDDKLWLMVIDTVTVHADGRMTFKFQGGTEFNT